MNKPATFTGSKGRLYGESSPGVQINGMNEGAARGLGALDDVGYVVFFVATEMKS